MNQIAEVFGRDKSVISRHIKDIFETGELSQKATVAKNATVQKEGSRTVERDVEYYNLDMIISIGYRVNSKQATKFRQWATKTLKSHVVDGYTINPNRISKNYDAFLTAVEKVKDLLPANESISNEDTLELVKLFAHTWFSLDAYDKSEFAKKSLTKKQVKLSGEELDNAIQELKQELLLKGEATELFANERQSSGIEGIVGNVFQSFGGKSVYESIEEKAAHLLYFIVKNHPFTDGNKRSGAFSFVWFLRKAKILNTSRITPEALTALTLLVAESDPKDMGQVVGLIVMLLGK
ncbi:MAG: virulence protein RhuM/Fic/DOC family protein [Patescibacteria group bacterium]